jgi:hypothetical protein
LIVRRKKFPIISSDALRIYRTLKTPNGINWVYFNIIRIINFDFHDEEKKRGLLMKIKENKSKPSDRVINLWWRPLWGWWVWREGRLNLFLRFIVSSFCFLLLPSLCPSSHLCVLGRMVVLKKREKRKQILMFFYEFTLDKRAYDPTTLSVSFT